MLTFRQAVEKLPPHFPASAHEEVQLLTHAIHKTIYRFRRHNIRVDTTDITKVEHIRVAAAGKTDERFWLQVCTEDEIYDYVVEWEEPFEAWNYTEYYFGRDQPKTRISMANLFDVARDALKKIPN